MSPLLASYPAGLKVTGLLGVSVWFGSVWLGEPENVVAFRRFHSFYVSMVCLNQIQPRGFSGF